MTSFKILLDTRQRTIINAMIACECLLQGMYFTRLLLSPLSPTASHLSGKVLQSFNVARRLCPLDKEIWKFGTGPKPLGRVPLCKRQSGHCDHSGSTIPSVASRDTTNRSSASAHATTATHPAHVDMGSFLNSGPF